MTRSPRALIVGCGIAGPVLAILLKNKGYETIVFEKVQKLGDVGASLMLMPNGMKVLGLIGASQSVVDQTVPLQEFRDYKLTGETLGGSGIASGFVGQYGQPAAGIKRTVINLMLKDTLAAHGIECREGWALEGLTEESSGITAHFSQGRSVSGDIVIGCDGIKAKSRDIILDQRGIQQTAPQYTGLSQTAGISPTPLALAEIASMRNWYGEGIHLIAYPISTTHTSWAITQREAEQSKETWRLYDRDEMAAIQKELAPKLKDFDPSVLKLVNSAERLTKYGLFDRKELEPEEWYSSRCVLVGDAAHPTSPHLGQGANQALEDCYHLAAALPDASQGLNLTAAVLQESFARYANKRQPRTKFLVQGARKQGDFRVGGGDAPALEARYTIVTDMWKDADAFAAKYQGICQEPF